jgi:dihydroorotase
MKTLIQNGRVIDPASGLDEVADIAIAAGKILAIIKKGESTAPRFSS